MSSLLPPYALPLVASISTTLTPTITPTPPTTEDIALCKFYRSDNIPPGLQFRTSGWPALIQEVADKVGVPSSVIAAMLRIESASSFYSDNPAYITNDYDAQTNGFAYGAMQFYPPTFEGIFNTYSSEMASMFGKTSVRITVDPQSNMAPDNVLRIYSIRDSIIAAAFKIRADAGTNPPYDQATIEKIIKGYFTQCTYLSGGKTYSYCDDVWKSYSECKPVGPKPTITPQPGCASARYQVPLIDQLAPGNNDACGSGNYATCGPVSGAMVLQSLNIDAPAPQVIEDWNSLGTWSCGAGFQGSKIADAINAKYGKFVQAGYHGQNNSTSTIFNIIQTTSNPVLVSTYTATGIPHMVVVEKVCPNEVTLADPEGGVRRTVNRAALDIILQKDIRGEVISFNSAAPVPPKQVCTGSLATFGTTKMLLPLPDENPVCKATLTDSCGRPGFCTIPTKIVLHVTASNASAVATYQFFADGAPTSQGRAGTATQFIVDKNGEIIQLVEMFTDKSEVAWGTAGYQDHISIEMVNSNIYNGRSEAPSAQYQKTLSLVKSLMTQYNIPIGNLEFDWKAASNQAVSGLIGVFGHYQLNPQTRSDPGSGFMRDFREDLKHL